MTMTARQIKKRIRYLLAAEIRGRIYETPDYLAGEPVEVERAWSDVIGEIADDIWLETRPAPSVSRPQSNSEAK
jgi:hypothetical protein